MSGDASGRWICPWARGHDTETENNAETDPRFPCLDSSTDRKIVNIGKCLY